MSAPQRIQLSRQKGWRKPEGAVVVARPSKWGNPIKWTSYPSIQHDGDGAAFRVSDAERRRWAVVDFTSVVVYGVGIFDYPSADEIRRELAGKDLACWCPLEDAHGNRVPCHADVLIRVANEVAVPTGGAA